MMYRMPWQRNSKLNSMLQTKCDIVCASVGAYIAIKCSVAIPLCNVCNVAAFFSWSSQQKWSSTKEKNTLHSQNKRYFQCMLINMKRDTISTLTFEIQTHISHYTSLSVCLLSMCATYLQMHRHTYQKPSMHWLTGVATCWLLLIGFQLCIRFKFSCKNCSVIFQRTGI